MERHPISAIPLPEEFLRAERRKHARFNVKYAKNRPFTFVPLQFGIVGHIKNVSLGGLSFLYFASRDRTKNLFTLDISSSDCNVFLNDIAITAVWDHPRTEDFLFDFVPVRRCGMRFRLLTNRQETDLQCFIENCTEGLREL